MLRFLITPSVDDRSLAAFRLWIDDTAPSSPAPADGDLWLDTSGTDTSIGNATSGALFAAQNDWIMKIYHMSAWKYLGDGGQKGRRATIPLPFAPARGTRFACTIACEASDVRFQLEGFGWLAAPVTEAK